MRRFIVTVPVLVNGNHLADAEQRHYCVTFMDVYRILNENKYSLQDCTVTQMTDSDTVTGSEFMSMLNGLILPFNQVF